MIITEQEKNRIRTLHGGYSIIKEQSIIADPDYKKGVALADIKWYSCSQDVKNISGPLLVYFNASWCAPCRKLKDQVY